MRSRRVNETYIAGQMKISDMSLSSLTLSPYQMLNMTLQWAATPTRIHKSSLNFAAMYIKLTYRKQFHLKGNIFQTNTVIYNLARLLNFKLIYYVSLQQHFFGIYNCFSPIWIFKSGYNGTPLETHKCHTCRSIAVCVTSASGMSDTYIPRNIWFIHIIYIEIKKRIHRQQYKVGWYLVKIPGDWCLSNHIVLADVCISSLQWTRFTH